MTLNNSPIVSHTIWNGSKTNHNKGRRKNIISASGQQITKRRHQRISAIIVFMETAFGIH